MANSFSPITNNTKFQQAGKEAQAWVENKQHQEATNPHECLWWYLQPRAQGLLQNSTDHPNGSREERHNTQHAHDTHARIKLTTVFPLPRGSYSRFSVKQTRGRGHVVTRTDRTKTTTYSTTNCTSHPQQQSTFPTALYRCCC